MVANTNSVMVTLYSVCTNSFLSYSTPRGPVTGLGFVPRGLVKVLARGDAHKAGYAQVTSADLEKCKEIQGIFRKVNYRLSNWRSPECLKARSATGKWDIQFSGLDLESQDPRSGKAKVKKIWDLALGEVEAYFEAMAHAQWAKQVKEDCGLAERLAMAEAEEARAKSKAMTYKKSRPWMD